MSLILIMRRSQSVIGIAATFMLLSNLAALVPEVYAQEVNVTMIIADTRNDTIRVVQLATSKPYGFEDNITLDINDKKLNRISKIFGTTTFAFNWASNNHEVEYYPWDVTISAPMAVGKSVKIKFV